MRTVLGIDAAWTVKQPSGVALLGEGESGWRVLAAAPSYSSFLKLAQGREVNWRNRSGGVVPTELPTAAARLSGKSHPEAVAVDMPLSREPIVSRRVSDNRVSHLYGARGASVHSPSPERPGEVGRAMEEGLLREGYILATRGCPLPEKGQRHFLEVYPHIAIIELLGAERRLPYKASKTGRYWPGAELPVRIERLLAEWQRIVEGLEGVVGKIPIPFPDAAEVSSLSALKPFEDALDAVVCAWVGALFLDGTAVAYGDEVAAIWGPPEGYQRKGFDREAASEEEVTPKEELVSGQRLDEAQTEEAGPGIASAVRLLSGDEAIRGLGGRSVVEFWRWAYSDVLSNAERGVFAEFLVAVALGVAGKPRIAWEAFDLEYEGHRVEVKSSAYVQSWYQLRPSPIQFDIERKRGWSSSTNEISSERVRAADVYVFCVFTARSRDEADILDLSQWEFFVVGTPTIEREFGDQKTVALGRLASLVEPVPFDGVRELVDRAVGSG